MLLRQNFRRNMYAQLTLGNRKRTDILLLNPETHKFARIEVKAKQIKTWSNQKGIYGDNIFLVFVDFYGKAEHERPDFYILSVEDWINHLHQTPRIKQKIDRGEVIISPDNVPVMPRQLKNGKPYEGCDVKPEDIQQHRERWSKITSEVGSTYSAVALL